MACSVMLAEGVETESMLPAEVNNTSMPPTCVSLRQPYAYLAMQHLSVGIHTCHSMLRRGSPGASAACGTLSAPLPG